MIRKGERINERDGDLAKLGAKVVDLARDLVHLLGSKVAVFEEPAGLLLNLVNTVELAGEGENFAFWAEGEVFDSGAELGLTMVRQKSKQEQGGQARLRTIRKM